MFKSFSKLTSLAATLTLPCSAQSQPYSQDKKVISDRSDLLKDLHGHFGTWYDSGVSANSPAGQSDGIAFWGNQLVLNKDLGLQSFNITLRSQLPLANAKEFEEFDLHLQWSRQINENLTLSLGLNNYFYPEVVDSARAYHELETRIDYIFNSLNSYFYMDQELKNNAYSYAALGASLAPIELGKSLSFTPSVELSAILNAGEVYTKAGLDNLALAGTLTYQMEENSPQFYFTLSANRGFAPEREKFAVGFLIGLQKDF